jgi:hypothetical protein
MTGPSKALLGAFLAATALATGAAAYSQTAGSLWDSTQLPETRGGSQTIHLDAPRRCRRIDSE